MANYIGKIGLQREEELYLSAAGWPNQGVAHRLERVALTIFSLDSVKKTCADEVETCHPTTGRSNL